MHKEAAIGEAADITAVRPIRVTSRGTADITAADVIVVTAAAVTGTSRPVSGAGWRGSGIECSGRSSVTTVRAPAS